jgi:formate-dependent nitrite reductase cytochrome c552 subunit
MGGNTLHGKLKKRLLIALWGLFITVFVMIVLLAISETNPNESLAFENEDVVSPDFMNPSPQNEFVKPWSGTRGNETTDPCLVCHITLDIMEEITFDWQRSKHSQNNVSCYDCHIADPGDTDAFDHNGYSITYVVSPDDCADCHSKEAAEFEQSLHSFGGVYYEYLFNREKLPFLESQIEGAYLVRDGEEIDHAATIRGCQSCHGTNMTGKTADNWTVWPNNGIGRINPDGSRGSCSACHTRHAFSIAEARHPETCGQCHMGPDHPQIEIFMESKHGNIYSAEGDSWNWSKKNWVAGMDYRAPTCAGCHMSNSTRHGTTHDVSSRLSWEIEPAVSRRTDNIANSLGVPFSDGSTWQTKQDRMKGVCEQCHSKVWVDNYYEQMDLAIELYNEQYLSAKEIVDELYQEGLLTNVSFDEPIEFKIYEMWHHEGRRARMGAVMQAPDYVQWHGFYDLLQDRVEIEHMAHEIRAAAEEPEEEEVEEKPIIVFLARDGTGTTIILKWEITNSTNVDRYDLYWGTSLIVDYESLTPNANTTGDSYIVEGLTTNTTYYFTIVAVDSDGNETAIAFSSAMPPKEKQVIVDDDKDKEVDDDEDEDEEGIDPVIPLLLAIVALLVGLIGMAMAMRKGGAGKTIVQEKNGPKEDSEGGSEQDTSRENDTDGSVD